MIGKDPLPPYSRGEEICNMVTHVVGGAFGISALVLCVVRAALNHNVWGVVSGAIYGACMILLFTMSSVYHGLKCERAKRVLRVLDHCTIYLLIAGTYTPIVLSSLRRDYPALAWTIFGVVWGAAILGITLTAINMKKFKVFSMITYLVMGWCIVVCFSKVVETLGKTGMLFIFLGGVLYTIGAVLYMIGKKKNTPYIHSIFHVFVLAACLLQFFAILFYAM